MRIEQHSSSCEAMLRVVAHRGKNEFTRSITEDFVVVVAVAVAFALRNSHAYPKTNISLVAYNGRAITSFIYKHLKGIGLIRSSGQTPELITPMRTSAS
ncbi:hypothetical protein V6N11_011618 [Hibiscus sabdariffa]|uniref:Uncharacterized protein n=1 Tax=Hibiscus sabdariffa TaxID=183260 RepID=A0ABR2S9H0_9ROSI